MRANSHLNSTNHKKRTFAFWIPIIIGTILLMSGWFGEVSSYVLVPFYSIGTYFRESKASLPAYLRNRSAIVNENTTLKDRLETLEGAESTIQYLQHENKVLKDELGLTDSDRLVANVIGRPPFLPYDVLLLDEGRRDGVIERALVYGTNDHAIGSIVKAYDTSSIVMLFSTPTVEATVYLLNAGVFATAHGEGGGVIRISVPHGISIEKGDIAVLPGLREGVLGTINEVVSIPTQPEQHAYVLSDVSLQSLRFVNISAREATPVTFDEALSILIETKKDILKLEVPTRYELGTSTASTSVGVSTVESH